MMQAQDLVQIAVQIKPSHFANENTHLNNLFKKLHDLHVSKIKIQIIFGIEKSLIPSLNQYLSSNVDDSLNRNIRTLETTHTIFYIIDDSKVLIKIIDPLTGEYNFTSVIIWESMFVDQFRRKFNSLWFKATLFKIADTHS